MGKFNQATAAAVVAVAAAVFSSQLVACKGKDGPQFSSEHPRIYIGNNAERLRGLLADERPAATHFKDLVDPQIGKGGLYDFRAWHVALMGQLTGEPQYCNFAVAQIEAYVESEYALIRARAQRRRRVPLDAEGEDGPYRG